jgi:hypothetical protein
MGGLLSATTLSSVLVRIAEYLDATTVDARCRCPPPATPVSNWLSAVGQSTSHAVAATADAASMYGIVIAVVVVMVAWRLEIAALVAHLAQTYSRRGEASKALDMFKQREVDLVSEIEVAQTALSSSRNETATVMQSLSELKSQAAVEANNAALKVQEMESALTQLSTELAAQEERRREIEAIAQTAVAQLTDAQQLAASLGAKLEATMAYAIALEQRCAIKVTPVLLD